MRGAGGGAGASKGAPEGTRKLRCRVGNAGYGFVHMFRPHVRERQRTIERHSCASGRFRCEHEVQGAGEVGSRGRAKPRLRVGNAGYGSRTRSLVIHACEYAQRVGPYRVRPSCGFSVDRSLLLETLAFWMV